MDKISVTIDDEGKVFHDPEIKYLRIKSTSFYRKLIKDLKKKKVEIKMNQNIEKNFIRKKF